MLTEILAGCLVGLVCWKVFTQRRKVAHYDFGNNSTYDHTQYDSFANYRRAVADGAKIYTEPLVGLFGIDLMNNIQFTEPDTVRSFFGGDEAQGHEEMRGFWELMCHYRELTNQRGAYQLHENELGLMRDLNPTDPAQSAVMKLARRRFLEFSASPSQMCTNLERIKRETEFLVDQALKEHGAFSPKDITLDAATNTGYTLACGFSFDHGTAAIRQASKWIEESLFQLVSPHSHKLIFMLIPRSIRKWIPLRYWPEMCTILGPFWDNLLECIDNHAKQFDVDDQPVCLLDTMQRDYQKGIFTYSDMFHTVQSMLIGSADTVSESTTLVWTNLARFPDLQQKCYNELVELNFNVDKWDDAPFTSAFIYETFRWTPSLHRSLFHTTTVPVNVCGHQFSSGSLFSFSTAGIATNATYFPDPYAFRPERFIVDGKLERNKNLMPFGYGRRSCPGKVVAEQQLLQFTVGFLKRCKALADDTNPLPVPSNEDEWNDMFIRVPCHDRRGTLLSVKHRTIKVQAR